MAYAIAPYSEPSDSYRSKFCIPYTLSVALIDRKIGLAQYANERSGDQRIRDLMKRVTVTIPDRLRENRGTWGEKVSNWAECTITVRLKDGTVHVRECKHAKGWPDNPATWDDLCGKFTVCSEGILASGKVKDIIAAVKNLEKLGSVRELTQLLAG